MLDSTTKKEFKKICDDATLEGLKEMLKLKEVQNNNDIYELIESEYNTRKKRILDKLPGYVTKQNYNIDRLVKYLCKGNCSRGRCSKVRWLELEQPVLKKSQLKNTQLGDYSAKCLKCGYIAKYCYNFIVP